MTRRNALLWLTLAALAFAPPAHARESAPIKTPHAEVTLVSDTDAVEAGKPFRLALRFKLAKGWHIYWINPGDAGEPPHLDLTLPAGAKASDIAWPVPLRIPEGPVMTYSYLGEVTLPFTVTPPTDAAPFPIAAKVNWLICEKICVPEEGSLSLDLPAGAATSSPEAPLFAAADRRMPTPSPFAISFAADGTLRVAGETLSTRTVAEAWVLPDVWGVIDDMAPQTLTVEEGKLALKLAPARNRDPKAKLSGVLAIRAPDGAETDYSFAAAPDATPSIGPAPQPNADRTPGGERPAGADLGLWSTLAFAFLGGLILNLMPCVFPILAIKAVGIARLSGGGRGAVRAHAASYTLGVLAAFVGLAGLLLALRAAGGAAGWGFQFQSPAFVAATAWLLFAVGLNLSGVFAIGGRFSGAGDGLATRGGHVGSFFTGLLAVLVATPCTAPFMGAAVAAALALSPAATLVVFAVMGAGLAAPYLLLALAPGLARLLPRPGAWMEVLKQALAFPMYAAAAWLVWVISQQMGPDGVLAATAGMVLIGLAAWAFGAAQARLGAGRAVGRGVTAVAVAAAFVLLYGVAAAPPRPTSAPSRADEEAYSPGRLAELRAEGRPVFVNMTAAWCVTCLVNERVTLSSDAVRAAFAAHRVAYLKGDWTRADPAITAFLREHARDGVPLYVLYAPKGGALVLPQILTAGSLIAELDRLGS